MPANEELREFLHSRRGRIHPDDAGLAPGPGSRRVSGLRREEVAMLAGVSVDYYCRVEQGKSVNPSDDVLDAIARALQLDIDERAYLFHVARPGRVRRQPPPVPQRVRPSVQALIDGMETPAFVLGRRMDVLATNRVCRALLCDFDALPRRERNMARWFFLDASTRELYVDWERVARENVAILRMDVGRFPDDPELSELIEELTVKCGDFATWWSDHDVLRRNHGTKRYRHPIAGDFEIFYEGLALPDDTDQILFVYGTEPGSTSEDAMRLLAGHAPA